MVATELLSIREYGPCICIRPNLSLLTLGGREPEEAG